MLIWRCLISFLVCLGKVHDFLSVGVDSDCAGHGGGCPVDRVPGQMGAFAAVVLLLYQVVPGPESYQMRIVGRCWNTHRSCTPHIRVA